MSDEYPPGWEAPSLAFLKDEPLWFRVPRKQAASTLLFGGATFMPTQMAAGIFVAIPMVFVVASLTLLIFRWLHAKDPYWYEHLTRHKPPMVRLIGN